MVEMLRIIPFIRLIHKFVPDLSHLTVLFKILRENIKLGRRAIRNTMNAPCRKLVGTSIQENATVGFDPRELNVTMAGDFRIQRLRKPRVHHLIFLRILPTVSTCESTPRETY
jgi:hypothetical protein